MSETFLPSNVQSSGQTPRTASLPEPSARLVDIPSRVSAEVRTERQSVRLSGEVVQQNDDGSVRIRTERGDIDVRLPDSQRPPQRGEQVQVEIQPNRNPDHPPETAIVRTQPQQTQRTSVEERHASTPVRVDLPAGDVPAERPAPVARPALPPEGIVVRLEPLAPSTVQTLPVTPSPQPTSVQIPTQTLQRVNFEATLIAQDATAQIQNSAAQILQTPAYGSPPPAIPLEQIVQPAPPTAPAAQSAQANSVALILQTQPAETAPQTSAQPNSQITSAPQTAITLEIQSPALAQIANVRSPLPITPVILPDTVFQPSVFAPAPPPEVLQTLQPPQIKVPALQTPASELQLTANITPPTTSALIEPFSTPQAILQPITQQVETLATPQPQNAPLPEVPPLAKTTPSAPEQLITQNQRAESVIGTVTNLTHNNQPVISLTLPQIGGEGFTQHFFALHIPEGQLPVGTQLLITPQQGQITAQTHSPITANLQAAPLPVLVAPQPVWPALQDVLQTLTQAAPQTAQAMINVTPSPASSPAQFGAAALFFVAALRGGDVTQWLGDKAQEILRATSKGSALNRLSGEGALLSRAASEPAAQDWRAVNIPMFHNGEIQKAAIYFKHERESDEEDTSALKGTRFVFDLALEKMGKVQLDGLFRAARLDLVLRTEQVFSQSTQAEMRRIYARALKDTGVSGELSFQGDMRGWVTIQAQDEARLGVSA